MSRSEFSRGVLLCIENAEKWIAEADFLAQSGSYGHATALIIHGIEALSQSWICFFLARGTSTIDDDDVKNFFKRHDIKLDFFVANLLMYETGAELYRNYFREEDMMNLNILPLINYYESIKEMIDKKRKQYPKELMEIRNQGIYVDYNYTENKFISPQDIHEKDYLKIKHECEILMDSILIIMNTSLAKYR